MKRYFAKLVEDGDAWGMNILVFEMVKHIVEQITTRNTGQEAKFTDFKFDEDKHKLQFVINGRIEELQIYEIPEATFTLIRREDNWKNLCHGLSIKSKKTVNWCGQRGIYG